MLNSVSGLPGITCGIDQSPLGFSDHDVVYTEADIWLRKVYRPVDVTQIKISFYNNVGIGCMIYSTEG
jgi:hypothetical protein